MSLIEFSPTQLEIQKFLTEKLKGMREKNPTYSLRAFARKLGIHAPALSEVLNGRRIVTKKMLLKIASRLPQDAPFIDGLMAKLPSKKKLKKSDVQFVPLEVDRYRLIADWYHFAILSLAELPHFDSSPEWISSSLGILPQEASAALERLLRMGVLEVNALGKIVAKGVNYATTDGVPDTAVKQSHLKMLELAKKSLQEDPLDSRDFTSIIMAIDPAKIPEARSMIRAFRNQLFTFLESGAQKEVYSLSLQLFPLSRIKNEQGDRL